MKTTKTFEVTLYRIEWDLEVDGEDINPDDYDLPDTLEFTVDATNDESALERALSLASDAEGYCILHCCPLVIDRDDVEHLEEIEHEDAELLSALSKS